jgi:hypothetical protein
MLPTDFLRRNVVLGFRGGRHRHSPARRHRRRQHDVGSDYPHREFTFSPIAEDPGEILARVPDDEQAKMAAGTNFHRARLSDPTRTYLRMGLASIGVISGMDSNSMPVAEGSSATRCERPP